jgi:hypothetical protein
MNSKNKALINYFAALIRKNVKSIEDVPEELRKDVDERLKSLEQIEESDETE